MIDFLGGRGDLELTIIDKLEKFRSKVSNYDLGFADVKGHENVKRALEIEAEFGHNLIMIRKSGVGINMLSKRIHTILQPFTLKETLETIKIDSVDGEIDTHLEIRCYLMVLSD